MKALGTDPRGLLLFGSRKSVYAALRVHRVSQAPEGTMQLDHAMSESLDKILTAASAVMDEVHAAYADGRLTATQVECVAHLRNDLGQLLAKLGDGSEFTGDIYQQNALGALRCYEEMAHSWLTAVYAAVVRDEWQRIGPGHYLVTRTRETADGIVYRRATCTNPAVATRQFDIAEAS